MCASSRAIRSAAANAAIKSLVAGSETEMFDSRPLSVRRPESGYNELADPPSGS